MRINKCILNQLSKKGFSNQYMLGMDFNGLHGYLYSMQPLKGAHVVTLVGNLELPSSRQELQGSKLVNSLLAMYELKEFWIRLKEDDDEKEEEEKENIIVDKSVFLTPRLAARKL
ncbi:hypothetical protein EDC96DRAFT_567798 [Choanephora cucurbitarum]|nr:hypothetical protein EDC96DRAFT_567798 [Choanephora cucurbitarum]